MTDRSSHETPANAGKRYLTPEDVIAQGPFGRTFVYSELRAGRLKAKKVGKRYIITPEAVEQWLTAEPCMPAPENSATGQGSGRLGVG